MSDLTSLRIEPHIFFISKCVNIAKLACASNSNDLKLLLTINSKGCVLFSDENRVSIGSDFSHKSISVNILYSAYCIGYTKDRG